MKYIAPEAEVVSLEVDSIIMGSELWCIIYDPENPGCTDKLPDFYD